MPPAVTKGDGHCGPVGGQPPPGEAEGVPSPAGAPCSAQQLRRQCVGNHDTDQVASFVDLQCGLPARAARMPH
jgi:hypothetical protein